MNSETLVLGINAFCALINLYLYQHTHSPFYGVVALLCFVGAGYNYHMRG